MFQNISIGNFQTTKSIFFFFIIFRYAYQWIQNGLKHTILRRKSRIKRHSASFAKKKTNILVAGRDPSMSAKNIRLPSLNFFLLVHGDSNSEPRLLLYCICTKCPLIVIYCNISTPATPATVGVPGGRG